MTAMTAVLHSGTVTTQASSIRAGVSAALAECLNDNAKVTMLAKEGDVASVRGTVTTDASKALKNAGKAQKRSKKIKDPEDKTICGYTNLGIANVSNYLNIREEAGEDAKIVGKLPAEAGCEILDAKDGWYRIRSGKVSG